MINLNPKKSGLHFFSHAYSQHFDIIAEFEKGIVREHAKVNKAKPDFELNRKIAFEKAALGHIVDIMPELTEHENELRAIIFPDAKGFKNADLRIDGILYEVEQPQNPNHFNSLKHRISGGARQADYVIIDLVLAISIGSMMRACHSKFPDYKDLQLIEFRYENEYYPYPRAFWDRQKKAPRKSGGTRQPVG